MAVVVAVVVAVAVGVVVGVVVVVVVAAVVGVGRLNMKHLAQALAILSKAENAVESQYSDERRQILRELEEKYAFRLRTLQDAKKSIQARFAAKEAIIEEYFGELKADTPRSTTIRLRRSIRREKERRAVR